jgi:hypothetical protein
VLDVRASERLVAEFLWPSIGRRHGDRTYYIHPPSGRVECSEGRADRPHVFFAPRQGRSEYAKKYLLAFTHSSLCLRALQ